MLLYFKQREEYLTISSFDESKTLCVRGELKFGRWFQVQGLKIIFR